MCTEADRQACSKHYDVQACSRGHPCRDFDQKRDGAVDQLVAGENFPWKLRDITAQRLWWRERTQYPDRRRAKLLDASGNLSRHSHVSAGGRTQVPAWRATNSVAVRTGNVSAGTSVFAMVGIGKGTGARIS